ncbi:antibiotic biosynthesis monooxygenase [Kocuria sp. p3-SID1433]|uniref:antibiotic biosynthesis monooxygenase family protein n=1 Tax=unclassified Kocuria TaxID=2649579 RepID=UPI0021A311B1|nr:MULTISPECIES: antibiotic biosynthesis monooxygenase [unclassified Kocuria]MCT1602000.1 antibiotic biosynthesis monooxygenase [Kocuria sp. p3-SID1428]MCT2179448.1 antibiotic biosynthesis monooxygenase [Kocuria sp. p3-SID1433]
MSVVKINVLSVPEGAGPELEQRFAARKHAVDGADGFEGFELLRPAGEQSRYFVVTRWRDEASFEAWRSQRQPSHESTGRRPVSSQAELLEFEVVDLEG